MKVLRQNWTKQRVLDALQEVLQKGPKGLSTGRIRREHPALAAAACRHFGTLHNALAAAGLPITPTWTWTPERVVKAIQARHRQGLPLVRVVKDDYTLCHAARVYFGTWQKALAAAGISEGGRWIWTKQRVIEGLQEANRLRAVRHSRQVHEGVRRAAFNLFGNWYNALVAAGLASSEHRPVPDKRWSKAEILKEIRRLSAHGRPVKAQQAGSFASVAINHFGSWNRAVIAAGLQPVPWQKWSPQRVLDGIIAWHRHGKIVSENDRIQHQRLREAARKRFGNWHKALAAAGIVDPGAYNKGRRRWTKESLIEELQNRRVHGFRNRAKDDHRLFGASRQLFGSWRAALVAAGIPVGKKRRARRRWTPEKVVDEIRRHHSEGIKTAQIPIVDSGLRSAAYKHFGNWHLALSAAGVNATPRRRWSRQKIIAAIRKHHRNGTLSDVWKKDRPLCQAGRSHFGSWEKALRAAGFQPRYERWSKQRVLQVLCDRYRRGQYNISAQDPHLYDAMKRYYGNRLAALDAAGLPPKKCPWSDERIIDTIRDYHRQGLPIHRAGFGDCALATAAWRRFHSWQAALAAAGVVPEKKRL